MITVVIPAWNSDPALLELAVFDALALPLVSRVLLVDDGSDSLSSIRACRELATHPRVCVLHAEHAGISLARARGVHAATTPYVLNLDSDDRISCRGLNPAELAPINFAAQNSPWEVATNIWDFIDDPGATQWGSIVRTDLARAAAADADITQEDLAWGYRLLMLAWRDQVPVRKNSGVLYCWRSPGRRPTITSTINSTLSHEQYQALLDKHFEQAIKHAELCEEDAAHLREWRNRRTSTTPIVRRVEKGARVDTHVLSYSGKRQWLQQTLASLAEEPTNVQLVMGGFPGSIGAARAYALGLGEAEYVSFADDDDWFYPGVYQRCIDILDARPDLVGVYTGLRHRQGEREWDEPKRPWHWRRQLHSPSEITHFKLMRRSAVMPYLDEVARCPTWEEYLLCALATRHGGWLALNEIGALKRMLPRSRSSARLAGIRSFASVRRAAITALLSQSPS